MCITVVSEKDANAYFKSECLVLPNGVDESVFYPNNQSKINNSFVFHGVLDYQVNIDSVIYMSNFLKKCSKKIHIVFGWKIQ